VDQAEVEPPFVQPLELLGAGQVSDLGLEVRVDIVRLEQAEEGLQPLQRHVGRASEPELHPAEYQPPALARVSGKFRIS
jgi:hypothetical protein